MRAYTHNTTEQTNCSVSSEKWKKDIRPSVYSANTRLSCQHYLCGPPFGVDNYG